ncbi:helix-turn-helix domain-containing protein [Bacteroides fragilis]|nr:helix-turn-helix domain-containing protein [Bacteroides fragilis]
MDTLDKETFREFMRQVFDRLDRHERLIASLTGSNAPTDLKEVRLLDGERLFDNQDLCLLLQVSKRSLQRYRSNGALAYHLLWHKTYYKESDVLDFIAKYMKDFQKRKHRAVQSPYQCIT